MTNVEIIKALKPGDWVFFNPCVFDSGGSYIRIVDVLHTETVLSFTYRQVDDGQDVAGTVWVAYQDDIGGDNTIYGLYIKNHTEEDIVNYISRCISNVGANAWNMLKVLHRDEKKPSNPLKVVNASLSGTLTLEASKKLVENLKKERNGENKS